MSRFLLAVFPFLLVCLGQTRIPFLQQKQNSNSQAPGDSIVEAPFLIILGTLQDGGAPQIGCEKACCRDLYLHPDPEKKVVSLGIVDPYYQKRFLLEATPDLPEQLRLLSKQGNFKKEKGPDGILVTHAHIGHYSGLMYLGKEAMNAKQVFIYAMPRMKTFLEQNGPWSQLVTQENIVLHEMNETQAIKLTPHLTTTPILVPHRDEYSETVGFLIEGPNKKALFIPDIDKWEKWGASITAMIASVDYAFIDGTFYDGEEINYRDIREIPHPFITESMALFDALPLEERQKVYFIHLNHTNPALVSDSAPSREIERQGFHIARFGDKVKL